MNTANTNNETSTPTAKAKVSKKAEAKAAAVTGLAAAFFVVVTLPPVEKFEQGSATTQSSFATSNASW